MREDAADDDGLTRSTADGAPAAPHWLVTPPIDGPGYSIEVWEYRFAEPVDAIYQSSSHHLEFALSTRPALGCFPEAFDDLRPVGQVTFLPAGRRLRAVHGAGVKRALICDFAEDRFPALADLRWSAEHLRRALDVRSVRLETFLAMLADEAFAPGVLSATLVQGVVLSTMVELRRYFGGEGPSSHPGGLAPWQLRLIRERLEGPHGRAATVPRLAADCGLSSRQLARAFRSTTGRTLGAYIKSTRMEHAKVLLAQPGRMIKQVAFESGFLTAAAFTAAFRKATGTTPNEYRKRARPGS